MSFVSACAAAKSANTLEELEAAITDIEDEIRGRWYELRTEEEVQRAAIMIAESHRGNDGLKVMYDLKRAKHEFHGSAKII